MKRKTLAWSAALAVLAGALVFFNLPPAREETSLAEAAAPEPVAEWKSDAPLGHEAGQQLPDFTLTRTDGEPFTLSEHRGQVVVINLWATWCGPCVKELPFFDALQEAHPDDVAVLAIHSDLVTEDVGAWLAAHDFGIAFAVDESGEAVSALGGSTVLPQTVVVNPWGEVTYNQRGSVTYSSLEELVAEAKTRRPE